jgi:hypothetical protein
MKSMGVLLWQLNKQSNDIYTVRNMQHEFMRKINKRGTN